MGARKGRGGRRKSEATVFLQSLLGKRVCIPWECVPKPGQEAHARDEKPPFGVLGRVTAIDKSNPGCVIVRLDGSPLRFFFLGVEVAQWLDGDLQAGDGVCLARVEADSLPRAALKYHDAGSHSQLDELADAAELETEAGDASCEDEEQPCNQHPEDTRALGQLAISAGQHFGKTQPSLHRGQGPGNVDDAGHTASDDDMASMQLHPEPTLAHIHILPEVGKVASECILITSPSDQQKHNSEEPAVTAVHIELHPAHAALQPASPAKSAKAAPPPTSATLTTVLRPPEPKLAAAVASPTHSYVFVTTRDGGLVPLASGPNFAAMQPHSFFHSMLYSPGTCPQEEDKEITGNTQLIQHQLRAGGWWGKTKVRGQQGVVVLNPSTFISPTKNTTAARQRRAQQHAIDPPGHTQQQQQQLQQQPMFSAHAPQRLPLQPALAAINSVTKHPNAPQRSASIVGHRLSQAQPTANHGIGTKAGVGLLGSLHQDRHTDLGLLRPSDEEQAKQHQQQQHQQQEPLHTGQGNESGKGRKRAGEGIDSVVLIDTPGPEPVLQEWVRPPKGYTSKKSVQDLLGQIVEIPGSVFDVDVPGLYYRGRVQAPDTDHADAVVIRMLDDNKKFYFPAGQVREWVQLMNDRKARQASYEDDITNGRQADVYAAEVLTQMSVGTTTSSQAVCSRHKTSGGQEGATTYPTGGGATGTTAGSSRLRTTSGGEGPKGDGAMATGSGAVSMGDVEEPPVKRHRSDGDGIRISE